MRAAVVVITGGGRGKEACSGGRYGGGRVGAPVVVVKGLVVGGGRSALLVVTGIAVGGVWSRKSSQAVYVGKPVVLAVTCDRCGCRLFAVGCRGRRLQCWLLLVVVG